MFPRVCAVCYKSDPRLLRDCPDCPSTSYCSDRCREADADHSSVCDKIKLQSDHYFHLMNGNLSVRLASARPSA